MARPNFPAGNGRASGAQSQKTVFRTLLTSREKSKGEGIAFSKECIIF
jgi:hypothetical protein